MQSRPDVDPERADAVADDGRTVDRARGTVESREEAVPDGPDLATPVACELATDEAMVRVEKGPPVTVAARRRLLGRADDVGEEDGREHPIASRSEPDARQELLDLADERIRVADPRDVVDARELDEPRARNPFGHVASAVDAGHLIVGAVEDQRRDAEQREHVAYVRVV